MNKAKIKNGWHSCTLSDVINLIGGGTPKTTEAEYWNGDIFWLTVADFNTGRKFVFDSEKKITMKGLQNSSTTLLNKGDVIISARGTVGVIAMIGKTMAFNQSCYGIQAKKNLVFNEYIYYLLKDKVRNFLQQSHGGVFDTITQNTFKDIKILLPPLPEQRAIAEVLSSLDDKIDLLHRQNKTLEAMAQALFRKWFVDDADEEWEIGKLGDVVNFEKGKKPTTSSEIQVDDFVPQILIETLDHGKVFYSKQEGMIICKEKDILMVMDGASSGRVEIGYNGIVGSTIGLFKAHNNFSYPLFIFHILKNYENHIKENLTGSAIPHADKKLILNLEFRYKGIEVIRDFEQRIDTLFQKTNRNKSQILILETLRNTLLPKLMCGTARIGSFRNYE